MKTMKLFTMLFLAMGVILVSCDKEGPEGPQGEIGPAGADGAAGEPGEQGVQGEKGDEGNANVIASGWINTDFDSNAVSYTDFDVPIPDLTRAEIDGSAVLAYSRWVSGTTTVTYNLPYVASYQKFEFQLTTNINNGYDVVFIGQSMNGTAYTFDWMTHVRYVIVPASTAKSASINLKKMSYEEVMDHFGLDY